MVTVSNHLMLHAYSRSMGEISRREGVGEHPENLQFLPANFIYVPC